MRLSRFGGAFVLASFLAGTAHADEGLWTFDNFPAAKVKAAYGVDITPEWRAKVQAASARLSIGCSSSVVGANGLLLTNDHCVSDCVQDLSSPGNDLAKSGFLATTLAEEKTCAGMNAEILLDITDETPGMTAAGAGLSGEALVAARNAAQATIEQAVCGTDPKLHCEMVDLYHGGQFKLYKYRKYSDVRLVFSPGDRAAFFGGDPDNFNFPRYDLDCAFLRLYEDGKPVATPQRLRWNPAAPTAGEPTFVSGNPGGTYREQTAAQLEAQRDLSLPVAVTQLAELRGRLIRFGEESAANAQMANDTLAEVENSYKVDIGLLRTLDDPAFLAAKRAEEADLKAKAQGKLGAALGDPWADMASTVADERALFLSYRQLERGPEVSQLFDDARHLVRAAEERELPSSARLPGYSDSQLAPMEKDVLDPRPVLAPLEQLGLEFWLSKSRELLTADDPITQLMLGKESPEALSARLVSGTKLGDAAVRKALWDGGLKAIEASDDPMIQYALRLDPEARRVRAAWEDKVIGPQERAGQQIAAARFAVLGDSIYPDGTFTLRLSYGAVQGWTADGKTVTPFTTFAGLYERATGAAPFDLDPRWIAAQPRLDPATVFDFVTNNDIIGGNSGSPVVNAQAEVIGTAFDGNIISIGGDYVFDPAGNRTVVLSAAAITEALEKVYGAGALVRELGGD